MQLKTSIRSDRNCLGGLHHLSNDRRLYVDFGVLLKIKKAPNIRSSKLVNYHDAKASMVSYCELCSSIIGVKFRGSHGIFVSVLIPRHL